MTHRNFAASNSRDRIRRQGAESIIGLDASITALTSKPKRRPSKDKQRRQLDAAVNDFLNKGNKITRIE